MHPRSALRLCLLLWLTGACTGNPVEDPGAPAPGEDPHQPAASGPAQAVKPPFAVAGELEGLLLVWFDEDGLHSARGRSDIPEPRRTQVRIDSLKVPPEARLDPEQIYIADVSTAGADGSYPVSVRTRVWFEAQLEALAPKQAAATAALADSGVTLYRTSWCGVCKSAASFMRKHDINFVEKDVEKDPAAQAEMLKKAQAVGKTPRGVPVIDFHGNLMFGFDRGTLEKLMAKHGS